jgi:hypothetical protein
MPYPTGPEESSAKAAESQTFDTIRRRGLARGAHIDSTDSSGSIATQRDYLGGQKQSEVAS